MISVKRPLRNQSGQTLVEFALAVTAALGIIGALIDLGVGFKNYSLLQESANTVSRTVATELSSVGAGGGNCSSYEDNAASSAETYLKDRLGGKGDFKFTACIDTNQTPYRKVKITGSWPLNCFFCLFTPKGIVLNSSGESMIENSKFNCAKAVPTCA